MCGGASSLIRGGGCDPLCGLLDFLPEVFEGTCEGGGGGASATGPGAAGGAGATAGAGAAGLTSSFFVGVGAGSLVSSDSRFIIDMGFVDRWGGGAAEADSVLAVWE